MNTAETTQTPTWHRLFGVTLVVVLAFGALTLLTALLADLPLRDPDGLIGPSYVRLPAIALVMLGLDLVPRVLLRCRRSMRSLREVTAEVVRERWAPRRLAVVAAGLGAFYVSYVAYRNLKSFLPFVREELTDPWLVESDRWLTFGGHPGDLLHDLLGTGVTNDVLSFTYMIFLPFVPFSLAAALVWSDNITRGAWYATALCFNWILGTASYYALPSMGPIYVQGYRFSDLPANETSALQDALWRNRVDVLADPHATQAVHGIAAFASLHTSIVFTAALVVSLTRMPRLLRWAMWTFFVLTTLATVYFGWHYLVDVFAGMLIGGAAVWLGSLAVHGRPSRRRQAEEQAAEPVLVAVQA